MPTKKSATKRAPSRLDRVIDLENRIEGIVESEDCLTEGLTRLTERVDGHCIDIDDEKGRLDDVEDSLKDQGPVLAHLIRMCGKFVLDIDNLKKTCGRLFQRIGKIEEQISLKGHDTIASRLHRVTVQAEEDRKCNSKRQKTHSQAIQKLNERMDEWQRSPVEVAEKYTKLRRASIAHVCTFCGGAILKNNHYMDTWSPSSTGSRLVNHVRYHKKCYPTGRHPSEPCLMHYSDYSAIEARVCACINEEARKTSLAQEKRFMDLSEHCETLGVGVDRLEMKVAKLMKRYMPAETARPGKAYIQVHDEISWYPGLQTRRARDVATIAIILAAMVLSFIAGAYVQSEIRVQPPTVAEHVL